MSRASVRIGCLAFIGFFLMIAGWSLAAPYDGSPDEIDHIVRAVGVVSGEVAPPPADAKRGTGAFQTVPRGLLRTNCWAFDPTRSAACAIAPDSDRTPVSAPSGAGRYFPPYYAVVGWPLSWWPGWLGVLSARLVSGAMAAAFLAGAVAVIARRSRFRLMSAGVLVGITPMATYMAAAVNPNGVEIAAASAFFVGLVHLMVGRSSGAPTGLLALVGLSSVALAVLRASSLVWLAVGFVAFLVPWSLPHVRALVRRPATWVWALATVVAGVSAFVWIIARDAADLGNYTGGRVLSMGQAWMVEAENWRDYLDQAVGVTGWLDTRMSSVFYLVWEFVAGALVVAAVVVGGRADRLRLALLIVGGVIAPAWLEVLYANETGFVTQGRYVLPMLVGIAVFSAYILEERGLGRSVARTATRLAVVLLLPIHLACFLYTVGRWQQGLPVLGIRSVGNLLPYRGDWHPVVGSMTAFVVEVVGLVVVGTLVWRLAAGVADVGTGVIRPARPGRRDDAAPERTRTRAGTATWTSRPGTARPGDTP